MENIENEINDTHNSKDIRDFFNLIRKGKVGFKNTNFKGDIDELGRFYARLKVARKFESIILEDITDKTTKGYEAYFRMFLAYNSLEAYKKIKYRNNYSTLNIINELVEKKNMGEINKIISSDIENYKAFFGFLNEKLTAKEIQFNIDEVKKSDYSKFITKIGIAIRHIFAHGILTPHSGKSNPKHITDLVNKIADLFITSIENDFNKHVKQYLQSQKKNS